MAEGEKKEVVTEEKKEVPIPVEDGIPRVHKDIEHYLTEELKPAGLDELIWIHGNEPEPGKKGWDSSLLFGLDWMFEPHWENELRIKADKILGDAFRDGMIKGKTKTELWICDMFDEVCDHPGKECELKEGKCVLAHKKNPTGYLLYYNFYVKEEEEKPVEKKRGRPKGKIAKKKKKTTLGLDVEMEEAEEEEEKDDAGDESYKPEPKKKKFHKAT